MPQLLLKQSEKHTSEWPDGETVDKIHTRDRSYTKLKLTKLNVEEGLYKEAQITYQNLI